MGPSTWQLAADRRGSLFKVVAAPRPAWPHKSFAAGLAKEPPKMDVSAQFLRHAVSGARCKVSSYSVHCAARAACLEYTYPGMHVVCTIQITVPVSTVPHPVRGHPHFLRLAAVAAPPSLTKNVVGLHRQTAKPPNRPTQSPSLLSCHGRTSMPRATKSQPAS